MKGLSEKDFKAAREAFQPSLKRDKKYDGSDIFTNPKLDESLYSALKKARNSSASVINIDPQEKIYRKQTDLVLDLGKPLLFMASRSKNKKKSKADSIALKSALMLWSHLLRNITQARRLNILSQVHPDHTGLLNRAAEKLPVGGEDLFGDKFIRELLSQVKVASRVSTSVNTTPSASSTPNKPGSNRPPAATPSTPASSRPPHRYDNRYVLTTLFSPTVNPSTAIRVAGRTAYFVNAWAELTKDY